jgi:pyridoxal phosphate enzyme (YggS family)
MFIRNNLLNLKSSLPPEVTLVAVTKTHPVEKLLEVYETGHKIFGENRVQEMVEKQKLLPNDIEWHQIGHLQSNKVKDIAAFVSLIHAVDSLRLLEEINKQALKHKRIIPCLLQICIASEETKFGLSMEEAEALLHSPEFKALQNISISGLMGMATNTSDKTQVSREFHSLRSFFLKIKSNTAITSGNFQPTILSMGMSSDYQLAIAEGSTMIRVGSLIFGAR